MLSKKEDSTMTMTRRNFLSASALTLLSCQLAPAARADCLLSGLFHGADTALPPKPLTAKVVDANPFMGRSESNIHTTATTPTPPTLSSP